MNTPRQVRATLVQLRSFEAVARLGGVGKAAQALHLAQPTVSTQLRELSDAVGLRLFEPEGRGLRLTEEGELLLQAARDVFERWRRFEDEAGELRGLARGRLRIAAVTTAEYFLPALLGAFARRYPGIEIELAVENRDAVVRRLERGDDELAVMMFPPEHLPIEVRPFLENPLVVIAARGHPLAKRARLRLQDLADEPRLTRESGSGTRRATDAFLADKGIEWPAHMALGSNEAIKHAVAAGLGLAVLSRHTLGSSPSRDGLVELKVAGFPLKRLWQVVWRRDRTPSRAARAFLESLLAAPASNPARTK
jgi:DNA-binding transcriptional LysR family regulator